MDFHLFLTSEVQGSSFHGRLPEDTHHTYTHTHTSRHLPQDTSHHMTHHMTRCPSKGVRRKSLTGAWLARIRRSNCLWLVMHTLQTLGVPLWSTAEVFDWSCQDSPLKSPVARAHFESPGCPSCGIRRRCLTGSWLASIRPPDCMCLEPRAHFASSGCPSYRVRPKRWIGVCLARLLLLLLLLLLHLVLLLLHFLYLRLLLLLLLLLLL